METLIKKLNTQLPEPAVPVIAEWIRHTHCVFRISKRRKTKFGDYRAPFRDQGHRISVNTDLNPYAFLVTTVHEFAHLLTWQEYKNSVKPHGSQWKANFRKLMTPFLIPTIFPPELIEALQVHLSNPAASSCSDPNLFRILRHYDLPRDDSFVPIETLPHGAHFRLENGRQFVKQAKRRTRFTCIEIPSQRTYLFSSAANVLPITENQYIGPLKQ